MTYESRSIKRTRRTKAEMQALRDGIHEIARDNRVCTIRQIYYLGIGRYWDKDTGGKRKNYSMVVRLAGQMREAEDGSLPWDWVADNSRYVRRPEMYLSAGDALENCIRYYRRDAWQDQPYRVEVWCESDSISGVIYDVTSKYGVGLYPCGGQSGKSFVREAAIAHRESGKPVYVIYAGDWDPSGLSIPRAVEERMQRYGHRDVQMHFSRVGVNPEDVMHGEYTSHSTNKRDPNYRRFVKACRDHDLDPDVSVEVEALPPAELRERIEDKIISLVDVDAWHSTVEAESSEREFMQQWRNQFIGLDQ